MLTLGPLNHFLALTIHQMMIANIGPVCELVNGEQSKKGMAYMLLTSVNQTSPVHGLDCQVATCDVRETENRYHEGGETRCDDTDGHGEFAQVPWSLSEVVAYKRDFDKYGGGESDKGRDGSDGEECACC